MLISAQAILTLMTGRLRSIVVIRLWLAEARGRSREIAGARRSSQELTGACDIV